MHARHTNAMANAASADSVGTNQSQSSLILSTAKRWQDRRHKAVLSSNQPTWKDITRSNIMFEYLSPNVPKTTYTQRYALKNLIDRGGAVMTSDWTTGAGRHTRARAIPPFCKRIFRSEAARYPARIKRVFAQHPRCQAVVAITDMRTARLVMPPVQLFSLDN